MRDTAVVNPVKTKRRKYADDYETISMFKGEESRFQK